MYQVKKMNYLESIEFSIVYKSYCKMKLAHELFKNKLNYFEKKRSQKALEIKEKEILKRIGINKANKKDFQLIIKSMVDWINERLEKIDDKKETKESETTMQWVIAYFAINFGYSKQETLSLYLEEMSILIEKGDMIMDDNAVRLAGAQLAPKEFYENLEKKRIKNKIEKPKSETDRAALNKFKTMQKMNYERLQNGN
jgi:hypothetical protein